MKSKSKVYEVYEIKLRINFNKYISRSENVKENDIFLPFFLPNLVYLFKASFYLS